MSSGSRKDQDDKGKDKPHRDNSKTQLNKPEEHELPTITEEESSMNTTTTTTSGDSSLNKQEEGQNGSGSGGSSIINGSDDHSDLNTIPFLKSRQDEDKTDDDSGKSGENSDSADEGISDAGSNSSSGSDNIHKKKKSNRCTICKKKVGLTGFMCRCGNGPFCSVHRYSDKHNCSFNYREQGALEISKANPLITAAKITKI